MYSWLSKYIEYVKKESLNIEHQLQFVENRKTMKKHILIIAVLWIIVPTYPTYPTDEHRPKPSDQLTGEMREMRGNPQKFPLFLFEFFAPMDRLTSKEKYDPSIQILYPSKEKYMTYIMRYIKSYICDKGCYTSL